MSRGQGHESFEDYICRWCNREVFDSPLGIAMDGATQLPHMCYPEDAPEPQCEDISMEEVLGIPKEKTNMSTVKVIARPVRGILAEDLNIGEYARIIGSGNIGDIVLRTRNGVVNLSNPVTDFPSFASPQVERLNTGDKLEITVGFTVDFEQRILDIAKNNNKIMAIKAVREATQWGLKESKDYVESLLES